VEQIDGGHAGVCVCVVKGDRFVFIPIKLQGRTCGANRTGFSCFYSAHQTSLYILLSG